MMVKTRSNNAVRSPTVKPAAPRRDRSRLRGASDRRTVPPVDDQGNRRGSPEAIEKRKAARSINDVLSGASGGPHKLDGRTEKRRQRLLRELEAGSARGAELKPLDVLQRVQELLELGEPVSSIRKVSKSKKPVVA